MRNIFLLGLVSLLTDASTEMMVPLLPIFLAQLGGGPLLLGWIEGLADATAAVLKAAAGRWSDRLGKRKPLVVGGYGTSSLARPLLAAATAPWHVLAVRVIDRIGKGLRTSPRDALIAASIPKERRGAAFGLHRAMDHAGAVIGPLIAIVLLAQWSGDLRTVFWWTAAPGAAAMLVLILLVREAPRDQAGPEDRAPASETEPLRFDPRLVRLLAPLAIFTLGNASDVFLLLLVAGDGSSLTTLPLLWMGLHAVKMLSSSVFGPLADRYGRILFIAIGWLYYSAIYAGFAAAGDRRLVWALFLAYGVYHGLTEGAERALIADLAPTEGWGTAFGWYHLTLGALSLAASVLFGALWQWYGREAAFLTSAGLAFVAVIALLLLRKITSIRI